MQELCLGETTIFYGNGKVSTQRCRRVGRVRRVRRGLRSWCLLNYNPQGKKGGTVVPPRDFHLQSSVCPVFIGIPP